jgi:hypothetical protein
MSPESIPTPLDTETIQFQDAQEHGKPMPGSERDIGRGLGGATPVLGTNNTDASHPLMPPSNGQAGYEPGSSPQPTSYPGQDKPETGQINGQRASFDPTDRPPSPLPNVVHEDVPPEGVPQGPGGGQGVLTADGSQEGSSRGGTSAGSRAGFGDGGAEDGRSWQNGVEMQPMPPLPVSTKSRVGSGAEGLPLLRCSLRMWHRPVVEGQTTCLTPFFLTFSLWPYGLV